jgi:hypothetical protein
VVVSIVTSAWSATGLLSEGTIGWSSWFAKGFIVGSGSSVDCVLPPVDSASMPSTLAEATFAFCLHFCCLICVSHFSYAHWMNSIHLCILPFCLCEWNRPSRHRPCQRHRFPCRLHQCLDFWRVSSPFPLLICQFNNIYERR